MAFCAKCGKELTPDAAYCHHCGTRVAAQPSATRWDERWQRRWDRHQWRERERDGWWGTVRAFGFLIILGLTISQYPNVFSLIDAFVRSWVVHGYPVLPGRALGNVIIFLFTASGIWGLVSASMRFAFSASLRSPMREIIDGLFSLFVAGLFTSFYAGTTKGSELVLDFVVGLAVVIVAQALISHYLPHSTS